MKPKLETIEQALARRTRTDKRFYLTVEHRRGIRTLTIWQHDYATGTPFAFLRTVGHAFPEHRINFQLCDVVDLLNRKHDIDT